MFDTNSVTPVPFFQIKAHERWFGQAHSSLLKFSCLCLTPLKLYFTYVQTADCCRAQCRAVRSVLSSLQMKDTFLPGMRLCSSDWSQLGPALISWQQYWHRNRNSDSRGQTLRLSGWGEHTPAAHTLCTCMFCKSHTCEVKVERSRDKFRSNDCFLFPSSLTHQKFKSTHLDELSETLGINDLCKSEISVLVGLRLQGSVCVHVTQS